MQGGGPYAGGARVEPSTGPPRRCRHAIRVPPTPAVRDARRSEAPCDVRSLRARAREPRLSHAQPPAARRTLGTAFGVRPAHCPSLPADSPRSCRGLLDLADRRDRLGAGSRRRRPSPPTRPHLRVGERVVHPDALRTLTPGKLTIATGEPAFEPWVLERRPASGKGFEAAVAYAAAAKLGYAQGRRHVGAHHLRRRHRPGPEDLRLEHPAVHHHRGPRRRRSTSRRRTTTSRRRSSPTRAPRSSRLRRSPTSSRPSSAPRSARPRWTPPRRSSARARRSRCSTTTRRAVTALKNKQVDGLVVDLPTAFYLVGRRDRRAG